MFNKELVSAVMLLAFTRRQCVNIQKDTDTVNDVSIAGARASASHTRDGEGVYMSHGAV